MGGRQAGPVGFDKGADHPVQVAVEHLVQIVRLVTDPVVADLGTGSGAIALAIAQEVPRAVVHAVEADPVARGWAERNVARCAGYAPRTAGRVVRC